jgi:hypothetical protein
MKRLHENLMLLLVYAIMLIGGGATSCLLPNDSSRPDSVKVYTRADLLSSVLLLPDETIIEPTDAPTEAQSAELCVFRRYSGVPRQEGTTADNPLCESSWGEFQADSTLEFLIKHTVSIRKE